ncbi:MAG: glycosyl transferase, group 1, partial [uncultured bacterium]
MKIALVHDQLAEFGGAERVLLAMSEIWPDAPIYTAFYNPGSPAWERFKDKDVRVSWAHHIPGFSTKLHSPLRFLASAIWNSFDFSGYDVIIGSSSWYITKGFAKKGKAIEICYCHTPPRWLYGYTTSKQSILAKIYGIIVGFFMRHYDYDAAQRVDYFIANSKETASRIKKFYRRDSKVIYPPIENQMQLQGVSLKGYLKGYYLVVSRLAQPKNVEIAIRMANKEKLPLKIVGTGPDQERLKAIAGKTVEFLGHVGDEELHRLYAGAKAF